MAEEGRVQGEKESARAFHGDLVEGDPVEELGYGPLVDEWITV